MWNKKTLAAVGSLALIAAGCALLPVSQATQNAQIAKVLNQISNTATADLNSQIAVANAATPPDVDGANCAKAALVVGAAMQKVLAATGATPGAFTVAEIATLYQPGSAQFNYVVTTLESGCIAKVHDVNQAANSTATIITGIGGILTLAPAVGL